ncbi:MAG: Calx-beta domain-containing protein [Planctomycetaceae bacterium]
MAMKQRAVGLRNRQSHGVLGILGDLWRAAGFGIGRSRRRRSRDGFGHVENLEARQVMSATPVQIGINLDNVNDYTPNWMFTDVFQSSRPWFSHSTNTVTGARDFNGGAFIPVQVDANGWPTQLATWTNAHGQLMRQRLGTVMFDSMNGTYPAGTYRAEWDGTADVVFGNDATVTSRGVTADGHNFALLNVTPSNGGIYLGIDSINPADPIRDIHVWMPDYNGQSFAGQRWQPGADFSPFHPLYKERIDDFGIIRFMQAQETNTSDIRTWADRRDANDARQSSTNGSGGQFANGISVEHMVQLANETGSDPWFNMPHMADDDFVRNFATYVRENLNPELTAYVEWSNEIWNSAPGFEAYFWIADQIRQPENSGLTHWQFAGREAARDMNIWSDVFAGQTDRIVRTIGGQATTPWTTERIIENMGGSFDAISIAPYFGPSETQRATYSAATTVDQVLNDMRGNIVFGAQMTTSHQRLADDFATRLGRDIQLLAYEGGPHLNGNGAPYQNALFRATKDPRMAEITRDYLRMQNAAGLDSYVHYKLTDRDLESQYGLFGVLFRQDQPLSEAHMYRALVDAASGTLFTSTPTLVTLNAADPQAHEAGLGTASFRVTRGGDLSQPLTVNYSVGGNAVSGTDYNALSGTVTFPANENTAFITVTPRNDTTIEGNETVSVALQPGVGYSLISTAASTGSISVISDDVPANQATINVVATDPNAAEAGRDPGVFTVTRTGGNIAGTLTVYLQNGFQTAQADYDAFPLTVTFAAGQTSATLTVLPIDDTVVENTESVILNVNPTTAYRVGANSSARVNIVSNDVAPPPVTPIITVAATDSAAAEVGNNNGVFTLTRTGALNNSLTVRYTANGTATPGPDFAPLGGFANFAWGAATTTITVAPVNDPTFEAVETVTVSVTDGTAYDLGAISTATVNITSDDIATSLPTVTIAATDANAAELNRDVAQFRVTRTGATTAALTVNYTISGTATNGSDYSSLSGSVVISVGALFGTVTLTPIDDTAVEANETATLNLSANAAYNLGTTASATATIVSDDVAPALPTVTLSTTDATAAEANRETGTLTVTRTGATTNALVVNYAISGSATNGSDFDNLTGSVTIEAGQTSATITVRPVDDTSVDANETATVTLAANAAYILGTTTAGTVTIADNDVPAATPLPVLIVIANNDFYYTEYSLPRAALEAAGIPVVVGAGRRELSVPHANTGYTSGNGAVMPDIALADARAENYSAIVFVGGWGAAQYQFAFAGTYANAAYNGTPAIREAANRLINEFVTQDKIVTGVCYGATVLAWSRVNGQSLLQGRAATTAEFNSPTNNLPAALRYRWHLETNGATAFTGGVLGQPVSRFDDVIVDGRIMTGENFDSARLLGETLADRLLNRNQPITTLAATDATAAEANRETGTLTVSRTGSNAAALVVNYSLGGTATNGSDYEQLPGRVLIQPGQTTGAITVRPVDDTTSDANETVIATLSANSAYALGATISGTVTIADNDNLPT